MLHSEDGLGGIKAADVREHKWLENDEERRNEEWGRQNNLTKIDSSFNYGITSKLYDGRLDCGGYYQLSRVQLKREGFGTRLPEALDINKFQMSVRGGSTCETPLGRKLDFDYFLTIYTNNDYYEFAFDGNLTPTDNNNITKQFEDNDNLSS